MNQCVILVQNILKEPMVCVKESKAIRRGGGEWGAHAVSYIVSSGGVFPGGKMVEGKLLITVN
jgi:hypothetical protein